ncbi:hypothetical protein TL16_g06372 [Triparma laevis f. inornata]|uniref:Uncharacterized protein n=1 Tax=Triparma laevis f. inornata TaxID=1714386 RepID=A0A9W7ARC2_9STRA|nr:hypothetical protein TL16_g06372 [Triparma laevis f. inornata]
MPPAPLTTLTAALALESSMEDEVAQITELILRSMDLTSLSASLSLSLTNLTTLSLSHNSFTSLNNFRNLKNLKDLNLNFNSLTSACVAELGELHFLKRLFLSNNQLDDEALTKISKLTQTQNSFSSLQTLCLYSNKLTSLPLLQSTLSLLVNLKDCSFEGNETSSKPGYRQAVIRSCKALEVLDGEPLEELDLELFADDSSSERKTTVPKLNLNNVNSTSSTTTTSTAFGGFNSDPVLLTYRASEMLEVEKDDEYNYGDEVEGEEERIKALASDLQKAKSSGSRNFVNRLRGSSVSKNSTSSSSTTPLSANPNGLSTQSAEDITRAASMLNVHGISLSDTTNAEVAPSFENNSTLKTDDPWEIVRKLLVKCETLNGENKSLKKHSIDGGSTNHHTTGGIDDMRKELECLRLENGNMYTLIEENKSLRKDLESLKIENEGLRMNRGAGKGAWNIEGTEVLTLEDVVPSYPEVGLPTPRTSSASSSVTSSLNGSRPNSRPSR